MLAMLPAVTSPILSIEKRRCPSCFKYDFSRT